MKGRAIIKAVLREHMIFPEEFFGYSRSQRFVRARRVAAMRMAAAGMKTTLIARLMKRDPTTIAYYLSAKRRERASERSRNYYAERCHQKRPYWTHARRHSEGVPA